jgi:hypothetical protein
MDGHSWALLWVASAGAGGGTVNAVMTANLRLLPSRLVRGSGPNLFRPGLLVNVVVGAAAAACTFWMFAGAASPLPGAIVGLAIGSLGARLITDEADKRVLRAAACKAAAAPAADPATIREMELAPPSDVLKAATALEPCRATLR